MQTGDLTVEVVERPRNQAILPLTVRSSISIMRRAYLCMLSSLVVYGLIPTPQDWATDEIKQMSSSTSRHGRQLEIRHQRKCSPPQATPQSPKDRLRQRTNLTVSAQNFRKSTPLSPPPFCSVATLPKWLYQFSKVFSSLEVS